MPKAATTTARPATTTATTAAALRQPQRLAASRRPSLPAAQSITPTAARLGRQVRRHFAVVSLAIGQRWIGMMMGWRVSKVQAG